MVKPQRLLASKSSAHQPGQGGCLRVTRCDNSTRNGIGPARGSFFACGIRPLAWLMGCQSTLADGLQPVRCKPLLRDLQHNGAVLSRWPGSASDALAVEFAADRAHAAAGERHLAAGNACA